MKVVWNDAFCRVYAGDPAATAGRMEPVVRELEGRVEWVSSAPAPEEALLRCHDREHVEWVRRSGVYEMAALAAGAAIQASVLGRVAPTFALLRPPGHHASRDHSWGFCYFNNLAVALHELRGQGLVRRALVLDFDLHFGDGTVNILGGEDWVRIANPDKRHRDAYLRQVADTIEEFDGDWLAVSAGFDNHEADWGGLLRTDDYRRIGLDAGIRARVLRAGCFAVLEGGYNHSVLGKNVRAFCAGMEEGWAGGAAAGLDSWGEVANADPAQRK